MKYVHKPLSFSSLSSASQTETHITGVKKNKNNGQNGGLGLASVGVVGLCANDISSQSKSIIEELYGNHDLSQHQQDLSGKGEQHVNNPTLSYKDHPENLHEQNNQNNPTLSYKDQDPAEIAAQNQDENFPDVSLDELVSSQAQQENAKNKTSKVSFSNQEFSDNFHSRSSGSSWNKNEETLSEAFGKAFSSHDDKQNNKSEVSDGNFSSFSDVGTTDSSGSNWNSSSTSDKSSKASSPSRANTQNGSPVEELSVAKTIPFAEYIDTPNSFEFAPVTLASLEPSPVDYNPVLASDEAKEPQDLGEGEDGDRDAPAPPDESRDEDEEELVARDDIPSFDVDSDSVELKVEKDDEVDEVDEVDEPEDEPEDLVDEPEDVADEPEDVVEEPEDVVEEPEDVVEEPEDEVDEQPAEDEVEDVADEQPAEDEEADRELADEKASDDDAVYKTTSDDDEVEDLADEQPADDEVEDLADEQPADEQPADEQPADEQPADEADDKVTLTSQTQQILTTSNPSPMWEVNVKANEKVMLYDGEEKIAETSANGEGKAVLFAKALEDGLHKFQLKAMDSEGQERDVGEAQFMNIDTIAPHAPGGITLHCHDLYTNDASPTLFAHSEPDSMVSFYVCGEFAGEARANAKGEVEFTLSSPLEEGEHAVVAKARDAAGNISETSLTVNFVVDTTAPSAPFSFGLMGGGSFNANGQPVFEIKAEINSTVMLFQNGNKIGEGKVSDHGELLMRAWDAFDTGSHSITAKTVDAAGNISSWGLTLNFRIGTELPETPTDFSLEGGAEVSNNNKPTFSLTAEAGSTITIYAQIGLTLVSVGQTITTAYGRTSVTVSTALADGDYSFTVRVTDKFGFESLSSQSISYSIDTEVPDAPTHIELVTEGEGESAVKKFKVVAEVGVTVYLYNGDTFIGSAATDSDGNAFIIPLIAIEEISYSITATVHDFAGNVSVKSAVFSFNFDFTPPAQPTGISVSGNGGNIITDENPVFTLTAEVSTTVILYTLVAGIEVEVGSGVADESGSVSITASYTFVEGSYNIYARSIDLAGNVSVASLSLSVTFDFTAPEAPGEISLEGGGTHTSSSNPVITLTAEIYSTVVLYTLIDNVETEIGSGTADEYGYASVSISHSFAEGTYSIYAKTVDLAGLVSAASQSFSLSFDFTAPEAPSEISLSGGGSYATTAHPEIVISASFGYTVMLFSVINGEEVEVGRAVAGAQNQAHIIMSYSFAQGEVSIYSKIMDLAGNISVASASFSFTIDYTPPGQPGEISLGGGGSHVSESHPTFTLTAEVHTTVILFALIGSVETEVGRGLSDADGNVSITLSVALGEGTFALYARSIDDAGNLSIASASFTVTIDVTAPIAPTGMALEVGQGGYATDEHPTLRITAEAHTTVILFALIDSVETEVGRGTAAADGNVSITLTYSFAEGEVSIYAKALDAAGNLGSPSASFTFILDYNRPDMPDGLSFDGGTMYANSNNPHVTLFAEAHSTVVLYAIISGTHTEVGRSTADESGFTLISITHTFVEGTFSFYAKAIDAAGNISDASPSTELTFDFTAPDVPTGLTLVSDAMLVDTDTPTFTVTATIGITIQLIAVIESVETVVGSGIVGADGTISITLSTSLSDGKHTVWARSVDEAGNISDLSISVEVEVDSTPPNPIGTLILVVDKASPEIRLKAEAFHTVTLYKDGAEIGTGVADEKGIATISISATLSLGDNIISAKVTDVFGRESIHTEAVTLIYEPKDEGDAHDLVISTTDPSPLITIKAQAGYTVELYKDNGDADHTLIGSAVADSTGKASIQVSLDLDVGEHSLYTKILDENGESLETSKSFLVSIGVADDTPPNAPQITETSDGEFSNNDTPIVKVLAEAKSTVTIYAFINGEEQSFGSGQADENGEVGIWLETSLPEGAHALYARAVDEAGNESENGDNYILHIDTTDPTISSISVDSADKSISVVFSESIKIDALQKISVFEGSQKLARSDIKFIHVEDSAPNTILFELQSTPSTASIWKISFAEGAVSDLASNKVEPTIITSTPSSSLEDESDTGLGFDGFDASLVGIIDPEYGMM
jgi:hypothetical protein